MLHTDILGYIGFYSVIEGCIIMEEFWRRPKTEWHVTMAKDARLSLVSAFKLHSDKD